MQRADDTEEALTKRLQGYHDQTVSVHAMPSYISVHLPAHTLLLHLYSLLAVRASNAIVSHRISQPHICVHFHCTLRQSACDPTIVYP